MDQKVFTLQEVNEALPFISSLIERIWKKKKEMTRLHENILTAELIAKGEKHVVQESKRLEDLIVSVAMDLKEIEQEGCVIRDLEKGIVDFYGEYSGQTVFFNWVYPEKTVEYWHALDITHLERRPLSD